jgi:hypothetical protein
MRGIPNTASDGRLRLRCRFGYTSQSANPCKERASSPQVRGRSAVKMKKTIISLVSIAGLAVGLYAQTPAAAPAAAQAQKNQKNWKDNAEYELYSAIIKPDATPAVRLQNLDKWKSAYPQSEYADTRQKSTCSPTRRLTIIARLSTWPPRFSRPIPTTWRRFRRS